MLGKAGLWKNEGGEVDRRMVPGESQVVGAIITGLRKAMCCWAEENEKRRESGETYIRGRKFKTIKSQRRKKTGVKRAGASVELKIGFE